MTSLTDRYVHAVTAHLPEDQRADIAAELRGTIEDTVAAAPPGTDPSAAEHAALLTLGDPSTLAASYRGVGRVLIGPRLYPAWRRTMTMLLSWVPLLAGAVTLLSGLGDSGSLVDLLGSIVSSVFVATVMVAFWVTVGYAIAERSGSEVIDGFGSAEDWDPGDLPEPQARQVSWGEGIAAVILEAFVLTLVLLPGRLGGSVDQVRWGQIFTDTAYSLRWVLAAGLAVSLLASVHVLARGRWSWPTAIASLAGTLLFTAPLVWLAGRNDLIAWDTLPTNWPYHEALGDQERTMRVLVLVLLAIALWEMADAIRKAARSRH